MSDNAELIARLQRYAVGPVDDQPLYVHGLCYEAAHALVAAEAEIARRRDADRKTWFEGQSTIEHLQSALAQARRDALEEAAKLADEFADIGYLNVSGGIRAL